MQDSSVSLFGCTRLRGLTLSFHNIAGSRTVAARDRLIFVIIIQDLRYIFVKKKLHPKYFWEKTNQHYIFKFNSAKTCVSASPRPTWYNGHHDTNDQVVVIDLNYIMTRQDERTYACMTWQTFARTVQGPPTTTATDPLVNGVAINHGTDARTRFLVRWSSDREATSTVSPPLGASTGFFCFLLQLLGTRKNEWWFVSDRSFRGNFRSETRVRPCSDGERDVAARKCSLRQKKNRGFLC